MRVTFRSVHDGISALNDAADQFVRSQNQVETGKRMQLASDDPAATQRVIDGHGELSTIDSYTRAGDTSRSRLSYIDTVMSGMVDKLIAAKTAVASAQGTTGAEARPTVAVTLQGFRDSLLADLNSSFRGHPLFSGSGQAPAYAQVAGAWTYQGDHTEVSADIAQNRSVTIGMDGSTLAKGADAKDIFTEMDSLIAAVQAGDETGMSAGMDALERMFQRTLRAQSLVGVDEKSVDENQQRLADLRLASLKRVSKDEDANLAEAVTQMTQAQTAYQSALQAVGSASKVSLLDYL